MRDIPIFSTEHGVASLTLSQIPYTKKAYIRIQSTLEPESLLNDCTSFCVVAGAEKVYATGHEICTRYPLYAHILQMRAELASIGNTDAALFPVTEATLQQWIDIYNEKAKNIPGSAWMTQKMGIELLQGGGGYFVHRDDILLGIGKIEDSKICWVASVYPKAGADVVRALCHGIFTDAVELEVASTNQKAIALYEKMNFIPVKNLLDWYCIK